MKTVIWDIEADGLSPTKIYCLSYFEVGFSNTVTTVTSYSAIREFFQEYDAYVAHNCRRWDFPQLERLLDITLPKRIIDSLAVSWYLQPGRKKHGLESYGEEYGVSKPYVPDWDNMALDVYINRCETDVRINVKLWEDQLKYLIRLYPDAQDLWKFLKYLDFKMYTAMLAERSKWRLDVPRCKASLERLEVERTGKLEALRTAMPKVPIVQTYERPKRYYNADGQLSLLGQRWEERLKRLGLPEGYEGVVSEVTGFDEPNPGSSVQVKDWLYSFGWVPQTIKYQRDKKTGVIKEIPQVNKEHGAGICESIKKLYPKEPNFELLDGLSVISHRISILSGFLRDVDDDGYVRAAVQGLTNTLRFKHATVVNLPKVEKKYGDDIRGCLICDDGDELCGADMSSLEDRIKQHFIYPHDPDYVDELNRPDYDPHLDIAVLVGSMTDWKEGLTVEQAEAYKNGDNSKKAVRSIYKNGNYASSGAYKIG